MKTFKDLAEVKAANKAIGHFFFERKTMSFFNSKIESGLIKGKYFITSEYFRDITDKKYTVRVANEDGSCNTIGDFNELKTKEQAKELIKTLS